MWDLLSDIPYFYPKLVVQVRYVRKRQNVVKIPICIPNYLQLMFSHISDRFRDLSVFPSSCIGMEISIFKSYVKIILSWGLWAWWFLLEIIAVKESYTLKGKILSSVWWLTVNYSGVDDRSIITLQIFISRKSSPNCFSHGMTCLPLLPLLRSIVIDIKFPL